MMTRSPLRQLACGLLFAATHAAPAGAEWRRDVLVPGINGAPPDTSPHGLVGISFGPDGALYGASIIGPGIFRFDLKAGTFTRVVEGLDAAGDDVAVAADGTLAWTGLGDGTLWMKRPGEDPKPLVRNLPMLNPVAFRDDGKIITGQVTQPDSLLEVDAKSGEVKVLARDLGGINAFQPDGKGGLWLPLSQKGAIGRFDFETEKLEIVADGLGGPVAVKADSRGGLYAVEWPGGHVSHINPISGEVKKIATVPPGLDNLAIGSDDTIYVSRPNDNSIVAIDPESGQQRDVFKGVLAAPGGLAFGDIQGRPTLIVSDAYGPRFVDLASRAITAMPFDIAVNAGSMVAVRDNAMALTYVRRGTLVVLDRRSGRVRHSLGGFKAPMGVMFEDEATLLVADYATGEIIRVKPGATPERATVIGGLQGPVGLAPAPDGKLYVTEATAGRLIEIDPATGGRAIIADRLAQPEGFAVLPDSRIAVAEVGARRLLVVSLGFGGVDVVAENLPIGDVFTRAPAPVFLPTGVAVDAAGALYISCDGDNTVLKFTRE
ncbi:MAG: hypothetical protein FJX59_01205 [Alphaproteobacteria bacterium]|nr:hypothetical protein [Alphaproteobacteria bacterium]